MIVNFESVKLRATKTGKCKCGKRLTRSTTFEQTINPFNKDGRGLPKTEGQIMAELKMARDDWMIKPPEHDHPSYWRWTEKQQKEYEKIGVTTVKMSCGEEIEVRKP